MRILDNGIAIIDGDTHIGKWVEDTGSLCHDRVVEDYILPHINYGDTVVDAGAFIGDHTVAYAEKVGPVGRVYAFEPNKEAFACLVYNTAQYPRVTPFNVALTRTTDFYDIVGTGNNFGASFAVKGDSVIGAPLDAFNIAPSFIKIDCEGLEIDILHGAVLTIQKHRPIIICESNKGALERNGQSQEHLVEVLKRKNYSVKHLTEGIEDGDPQYDLIAIPE